MTRPEPQIRSVIVAYVDDSLRSMPEHLRAGVVGESLLLGTWAAVARKARGQTVDDLIRSWHHSRIGLVRQYVRLLGGLVLLAEQEDLGVAA